VRIAIYGAGAIGGWLGARLGALGHDISMVARNANLDALKRKGLTLKADGNADINIKVKASDNPADLGVQDLVIVSVKAQAMPEIASAITPLFDSQTMVLSAMNGVPWWFFDGFGGNYAGTQLQSVDPTGSVAKAIAPERIIGCVVHASCATPEPGVVRNNFGNRLILGEPNGKISERLTALVQLHESAGYEVVKTSEIQKDVWFKLWGNMTVNPIAAMTGATTDKILADDLVRSFINAIMMEAKEIGARIGLPIDQNPDDRHVVTARLGTFKPSMLQDVEAGKSVELDALVTVVQELGRITGVVTPNTDILLGLSRLHARTHGLYPLK
jgi:2-dehydropantoate 2-reductase